MPERNVILVLDGHYLVQIRVKYYPTGFSFNVKMDEKITKWFINSKGIISDTYYTYNKKIDTPIYKREISP